MGGSRRMRAFTEPLQELEEFQKIQQALKKQSIQVTGCIDAQKAHFIYAAGAAKKKLIVTYSEMLRKMPLWSCRLQHTQPHAAMFLQFFGCHLALTEQVHLSRQHIPFFQSVCHALPELLFDRLCFLPEAVRFI